MVVVVVTVMLIIIILTHYTHAFKHAGLGRRRLRRHQTLRDSRTCEHAFAGLYTPSDCACLFFCEGYIRTVVDHGSMLNMR